MKILYIGHYKEGGGWSKTAIDHILALDRSGFDVVCQNVKLTNTQPEIPPRILELEKKDPQGCDICIQHVLPHHLVGSGSFKKNIAYVELETTSIRSTSWFNYLQLVDELWVPNQDIKDGLLDDNVGIPIHVVHHTHNIDVYTQPYETIDLEPIKDDFKFYFIGDLNDRKNIESIVRCFHSEFQPHEPASLILKVGKFGKSPQEVHALTDQIILRAKQSLRMYPDLTYYKKDVVISNKVPENKIYALHKSCDCFISPSHGEAWSIPSFDAMAFGNTPICSNFGGPKEFINPLNIKTGALVNGIHTICNSQDSAFPHLFTGREYWFTPSEKEIREYMRHYYTKRDKLACKQAGINRAREFTYQSFGKRVSDLLDE